MQADTCGGVGTKEVTVCEINQKFYESGYSEILHNVPWCHCCYSQETHDRAFGQIKSSSERQTSQTGERRVSLLFSLHVVS